MELSLLCVEKKCWNVNILSSENKITAVKILALGKENSNVFNGQDSTLNSLPVYFDWDVYI